MNGFQLAGRALRVEIKAQPPAALLNATAPGVANPVMVTPTGGNFAVNVATVVPPSNNFEERLEEPMGGNLNQISRVELMHKLARTEQPTNIPVTDMFRPNIPTATSRSVLLKNMFNPEEETEQGWDVELRDDVKGECEEKYGPVLAIAIEKESSAGDIYITFDSVPSAQKLSQVSITDGSEDDKLPLHLSLMLSSLLMVANERSKKMKTKEKGKMSISFLFVLFYWG
ncbi:hypothetical protein KEM48_013195 [Puccinia striiformis f. sp. tritici PST-130]|nr:hypothetical protein KEM48_013195 [Puccinia striiformis f. sp. tritici PST-130]